ncbi:MAG TPA: hypothetical protein VFG19_07085 [Geobacteraceae bacterium]|nr:hypothetical protein [Geobacteraceae bacterium]
MFCPKCRAKIGLYRYQTVTQSSIARGVTCAVCGYWKENTPRLVKEQRV